MLSRLGHLALPIAFVAGIFVIIVPLPAAIMDVLLAVNIAMAVLILLTTVNVGQPLEFSTFPTVLLAATLSRLVLNVATTRLILTSAGSSGSAAAGQIVEGFGQFVTGNNALVGFVLFAIIILIQFVVITQGATRISEVAARFALDGMPGRQMAIDADANAGMIDRQEARRLREQLAAQADFFGAMDGASKFVRGDAVAGMAITGINILGGLIIGVWQYGMSPAEAVSVFTRLTIGDGLVSQIPAFLVAVAAGVLITRSTQKTDLSLQFLRQLLMRPEPLVVAAAFLGLLIFTQLPALPLLLVGGGLAGWATLISRQPKLADAREANTTEAPPKRQEPKIEDLLGVDPLELELGVGLLRLADPRRGGDLLERVAQLRQGMAVRVGTVLPKVRVRDNLQIEEFAYRLKIFGDVVARGTAFPMRCLATSPERTEELEGVPGLHPVSQHRGWWVDPDQAEELRRNGFDCITAMDVITQHLAQLAHDHAGELLNRDATRRLVDQIRQSSPAVVEELIPQRLSLGQVQQVLQSLLAEQVSLRNLATILEALTDAVEISHDHQYLVEHVRQRLGRSICSDWVDGQQRLHVATLGSPWERALGSETWQSWLAPTAASTLVEAIQQATQGLRDAGRPPVLLVSSELRPRVRQVAAPKIPELVVLSYREVPPEITVRSGGMVDTPQPPNEA